MNLEGMIKQEAWFKATNSGGGGVGGLDTSADDVYPWAAIVIRALGG